MFFEYFWFALLIFWGCLVAYRDLATYRISNSDLRVGFIVVWPGMFFLGQNILSVTRLGLLATCVIIVGFFGLIGMGDVKLLLIFAPWIHLESWLPATTSLIAIAWVQIGISLIRHRSFPKKVAFAPAILLAMAVNLAS